jgi:hypothetical protein
MATKTVTKPVASKTVQITEPIIWGTAVLVEMNKIAASRGKRQRIPITVNNIETLLRPITGEGSLGQQGGFLRDNNPWNIGTGCKATGAYGGTPNAPYGPDARCGGGPVYLNTFATPLAGAKATAQYLFDTNSFASLAQNAPSSMALAGTWYKSDAAAASAVPVTAKAVAQAAKELGTLASPLGPVAPPAMGKPDTALAKKIVAYFSSPHKGSNYPASIEDKFTKLSAADQKATVAAAEAMVAPKGGNSPQVKAALKMDLSKSALGDVAGPAANDIANATGIPSGIDAIGGFFSDLTSSTFWKRIGIGALGVVLLGAGVLIFLQSTKPVQAAEGAALKVV